MPGGSRFRLGSRAVRLKPSKCFSVCPSKQTQGGFEYTRTRRLNVDAAVLHRLNCAGDLDQLAGGDISIGEGASSTIFIPSWAPDRADLALKHTSELKRGKR